MSSLVPVFNQLNVRVLAVSTDSVYSHKVFGEISPSGRKIRFPLISDRTRKISQAYGVYNELEGVSERAAFIIAPGGKVKFSCLYPPLVGINIQELIRVIKAIQYQEASGLGVPGDWQPGMLGIPRDFSLVGKF